MVENITDKEIAQITETIQRLYKETEVAPPKELDETIMKMASKNAEILKKRKEKGSYDEFLALAAAEDKKEKPRKLTSKTGDWTLSIYEDEDDPDYGSIVIQLHPERLAQWKGRTVEVQIGNVTVLSEIVDSCEIEADVCFRDIDMTATWRVSL